MSHQLLSLTAADTLSADGMLVVNSVTLKPGQRVVLVRLDEAGKPVPLAISLDAYTRAQTDALLAGKAALDSDGKVLASQLPPAAASYTDQQARAAQLNRVAPVNTTSTTVVTLTPESPVLYRTRASGTFVVDATDCVAERRPASQSARGRRPRSSSMSRRTGPTSTTVRATSLVARSATRFT